MAQILRQKMSPNVSAPEMFRTLLGEIRRLRQEISLVLPQENLNEYADPRRIKRSYQRALKQYPPEAV